LLISRHSGVGNEVAGIAMPGTSTVHHGVSVRKAVADSELLGPGDMLALAAMFAGRV